MSKDQQPQPVNDGAPRSFIERLALALMGEPGTRAQLVEVLRDAQSRDLLDHDALDMIEGVMQVSEMQVRDIMVPRAQMDVVDFSRAPDEFLPVIIESGHSRFPVIDADKDRVIGILLAKDLLRYLQLDKKKRARFNLRDMLRPAVFVPEAKRLNVLLREFKASRNHMAIVVDEYGGVGGLVTIEDVIEQIVGEIRDEYDIEADDVMIVAREGGEYVVKAQAPLDDFNTRFATRLAQGEIDTIGGIVMARLGRVPRRGEKLDIDGLRFEVLRADSRRMHLLKVTRLAGPV
jgi:magnesium and cobalt transporter